MTISGTTVAAIVAPPISTGPKCLSSVCPTAALSPIATRTHGMTSIPISTYAPSTNVSCHDRRRTGNQSNASAKTDPAITGSSRIQASATGSSITSTMAPRDGPSLQPDQGVDMKTRLENHTCKRAATASGRLSRYFIRYSPDSQVRRHDCPSLRVSQTSGCVVEGGRPVLGVSASSQQADGSVTAPIVCLVSESELEWLYS